MPALTMASQEENLIMHIWTAIIVELLDFLLKYLPLSLLAFKAPILQSETVLGLQNLFSVAGKLIRGKHTKSKVSATVSGSSCKK